MDGPQESDVGKAGMNALDALRYDWGSAYEIEHNGEEWRARRLDGLGGWIEADSPDDLRNQVFSDYALKPVRVHGSRTRPACHAAPAASGVPGNRRANGAAGSPRPLLIPESLFLSRRLPADIVRKAERDAISQRR